MAKTEWRKGIPIDEEAQARMREILKEKGEKETAEFFGVGVISVVRAAAGCGLRRGTMLVIKTGLANLRGQRAA